MRLFLVTLAVAATSTLQAGLTVPNGPWETVVTPVLTANEVITTQTANLGGVNNAYWNNSTFDSGAPNGTDTNGVCRNIGCYVTGIDNTDGNSPLWNSNPVYLAKDDTGAAATSITFGATPAGPSMMLTEIAGLSPSNWLGWYNTAFAPGGFTSANKGTAWDAIFLGAYGAGAAVPFSPSFDFGFWFLPGYSDASTPGDIATAFAGLPTALNTSTERRFTNSALNGAAAGTANQYFAVFAQNAAAVNAIPTRFVIGVEDHDYPIGGTTDGDFNDMIFSIVVVPEPGYYVVLSLGLLGLAIARRRMKTAVN